MDEFFDFLNSKSDRRNECFAQPRMGVVASSDSLTATAKVLLQPEGVLTGWLPVLTQWAGSGWGLWCPPSPGDQVLIIPQEGDAQHGLIVGRLFSNLVRPPTAEVGEITIGHQSGCLIRLLNSGTATVEGDLHVSGDVYDAHGSLSQLRNDYNTHTHQNGMGGNTSTPLALD
jgi:phage baseplate assembly protein gpV